MDRTLDSVPSARMALSPFPSAGLWAVKVVQAIVRSGSTQPIEIKVTRRTTSFKFQLEHEAAFQALGASSSKELPNTPFFETLHLALRHLIPQNQRNLRLELAGSEHGLTWQSAELTLTKTSEPSEYCTLVVEHPKGRREVREECASISKEISQRCFTCPVPLTLDGRRLDSLLLCPGGGWNKGSFPLLLRFLQSDLPTWKVPGHTFFLEQLNLTLGQRLNPLRKLHHELVDQAATLSHVSVAAMVSAHKNPEKCQVFWIKDGVVIEMEPLGLDCRLSVSLFLSAQDLDTELSTFPLVDSDRVVERVQLGIQSVNVDFQALGDEWLAKMSDEMSKIYLKSSFSTLLALYSPVHLLFASLKLGFPMLGLLFGMVTTPLIVFTSASSFDKDHWERLEEEWRLLKSRWDKLDFPRRIT